MGIQGSGVRPTAVAGRFYPANPVELGSQLVAMLARADAGSEARATRTGNATARPPKILIAPHAGYVYSGSVAAHAYRLLQPYSDAVRRVVVIGPSHRVAFRGIAVPNVAAFRTPLGDVALDLESMRTIAALPQVVAADSPHAWEHAIEVQLPFLQTVLRQFEVVPLVVGNASPRDVAEVLEALWGGDETVIVVSSDLSHFHEHSLATGIDGATARAILELQAGLDHEQACGATPINAAILCARRHGLQSRLLDLRNSGDTAGGRDRVVGYCSIAFEDER